MPKPITVIHRPVPKQLALALLGGNYAEAARRIGCSRQAVEQWPDPLPDRIGDRVMAACVRFRIEERLRKKHKLEAWEMELVSVAD